jgi:hypothetical protein
MTHDPAATDPTTPLANRRTDQSQHDHATTAHPTSHQRPKITNRTAYLGITIRRIKNPDKTGSRHGALTQTTVDLGKDGPRC